MGQLQVLIADDSEFMRIAYKRILETESSLLVVAMVANGAEAVQKVAEMKPDVAILDVWMPTMDGLQAAHEIRRDHPDTAIVVISSYDDLTFVADLMRNGVERKAYLVKRSITDIAGLVKIVEAVHGGHTILDSGIVQRLARLFCKHSDLLDAELSGIEQDVLGFMAEGYDDSRICETLHINQQELEDHLASLYRKFGLTQNTPQERRMAAIQTFVNQIHKVPLSRRAYDAVG